MDSLVSISETKVIECIHCKGTGRCKNYTKKRHNDENGDVRICYCDFCGEGQPARARDALVLTGIIATIFHGKDCLYDDSPSPPTCRVCNGVGSVRI